MTEATSRITGRKALCVGINKFQNHPQFTLNGCVNDAIDMAALFKDLMGLRPADITTLVDEAATKATVMAQLKALVDEAVAGKLSYIGFSFSSHGTQMKDITNDEKDGMDEAFVTHDIAEKDGDWDPAHIICDDDFHDLFMRIPVTCTLEAYLDTCHSGTGFKDPSMRPRYIPPISEPALGPSKKVRGFTMDRTSLASGAPDTDTKAVKNIILWTGCRSNQTSADAYFNGRYNGAFTYNYIKAMRSSGGKLPRAQVLANMKQLMAGQFDQVPQLEADATNRNNQVEQ